MALGFIFAVLGGIKGWTNWFNHITTMVFASYALVCIVTYLFLIIYNACTWITKLHDQIAKKQRKITELSKEKQTLQENRQGLLDQLKIDKDDKQTLQNNISFLQTVTDLLVSYIPEDKLEEFRKKLDIKERIFKIERDSRSQNNKYKTNSD